MRVSVQLPGDGAEFRSLELGADLTLIRRVQGSAPVLQTPGELLEVSSLDVLEQQLENLSRFADLSALKAECRSLSARTAAASGRALQLDERQFQLLWNAAQVWIAALVLFPVPLLVWSWDELFGLYIPHALAALAAAGSVYFLREWWKNRPAYAAAAQNLFELELSLRGVEERLGGWKPLVLDEAAVAKLAGEDAARFAALLVRYAPARDLIVLAFGETGRELSRQLIALGAAETPEAGGLAVTRV